jgi:MFS family permease
MMGTRVSDLITSPRQRVVTWPFVVVTAVTLVFFTSIGVTLVTVPLFVERELGAGEFGIGLTIASFAAAAIAARPLITRLGDRYGRRRLMMGGAVLAAAGSLGAGFSETLPMLLVFRGITGVGEAALFVGAITLIADLSPPHRRAEAASYFSIAGVRRARDRTGPRRVGPRRRALPARVPHRRRAGAVDRRAWRRSCRGRWTASTTPMRYPRGPRRGILHPAAIGPGLVLASIVAAFSTFTGFIPEHARAVGLSGAGGLFLVLQRGVPLRTCAGAKVPTHRAGRAVSTALVFVGASLLLLAAVPQPWALWAAAAGFGIGMAFNYPSLMAIVVNRVDERERVAALSSFTMFFGARFRRRRARARWGRRDLRQAHRLRGRHRVLRGRPRRVVGERSSCHPQHVEMDVPQYPPLVCD